MSAEQGGRFQPGQRVFVTKYALSRGILDVLVHSANNDRVCVLPHGSAYALDFAPKDVHPTLEEAQARVRTMCDARRKSLAKALLKIDRIVMSGAKVVKL